MTPEGLYFAYRAVKLRYGRLMPKWEQLDEAERAAWQRVADIAHTEVEEAGACRW